MPKKNECKEVVLSSAKQILIAPYDATKIENGTAKASARDIGFTSGGVTLTEAFEKTAIMVDQSATPIRDIVTAVGFNLSIPMASLPLENLKLALQVALGADGKADFLKEAYYSVWVITDGPVNAQGHLTEYEYFFEKMSFAGTPEIAMSRTDMQNPTLEGKLIHCPDPDDPSYIGLSVTQNDPDESESI